MTTSISATLTNGKREPLKVVVSNRIASALLAAVWIVTGRPLTSKPRIASFETASMSGSSSTTSTGHSV